MNWKRIVTFNLTGNAGKETAPSLFPTYGRLRRLLPGRRGVSRGGFELNAETFAPGKNYRALGKHWKGPVYFSGRNHSKDLQYVIGQIKSFVSANVPLARGFEAAAREEQRLDRGLGSVYALKQAFWSTGGLLLVLWFIRIIFGSSVMSLSVLLPLAVCLCFVILMIRTCLQGRRTATIASLVAAVLCAAGVAYVLAEGGGQYGRRNVLDLFYINMQDLAVFWFIAITVFFFAFSYRAAREGGPREMVLVRLRDLLESGHDLSEAMRRLPRFFPRFFADMVEAGEDSGRMDACLAELNEETSADLRLHRQLYGTFLYFGFVGLVQLFIFSFLMLRVIPVFLEIHREFESEAPSRVITPLISIYDSLTQWRWNMLGTVRIDALQLIVFSVFVVVVSLILFRILRRRRRSFSSRPLASLLLFLPGFRGLVMQDNFTVITCILEKLLHAGVPLETALEKAAAADLNPRYTAMLRGVRARILEGDSFVAAFQSASGGLLVPPSFTSLTAVGEQSGMLPEALGYLHTFYRTQAAIRVRILVDAVKPLGVIIMGLVTLLFIVDVFQLIAGLSDAVINGM